MADKLSPDEFEEFVGECLTELIGADAWGRIMVNASASPIPSPPSVSRTEPSAMPPEAPRPLPEAPTPITAAQAFVLSHPEGVTTAAVARSTGLTKDEVAINLAFANNVQRTYMKWHPGTDGAGPGKTIREGVCEVLEGGAALTTGEIHVAIMRVMSVQKTSLASEVMRMKRDGLMTVRGTGAHGGALYALTIAFKSEPGRSVQTATN